MSFMWLGAAAFQHAVAFNTTPTKASLYELFYNPYIGRIMGRARIFTGAANTCVSVAGRRRARPTLTQPHRILMTMSPQWDIPSHITSETTIEDLFVLEGSHRRCRDHRREGLGTADAVVSVLRCSDMHEYPRFFRHCIRKSRHLTRPQASETVVTRYMYHEVQQVRMLESTRQVCTVYSVS